METQLKHVDLDQIVISASNKMFRDESEMQSQALHDLTASIKEKGVIQPVLLRPAAKNGANTYELVCGERRFRASREAKLKNIPAYIRPLTDDQALEAQVIENLQRENVNPMKEAIAFEWMTKTKKMSTKHIADRIGKSIDYVQERIRLTTLSEKAQNFVRSGVLPLKAALKLASVPAELHDKALNECITTVEGATKQHAFRGLERLQNWLSNNVFRELAFADFDINDANLRPAAGSCMGCTKRTKNAGGLFDDVAKKDMCLDGACFVQKQLAQYEKVKSEVIQNFPGAEIVYQSRSYSVDAAFKKLTPVIDRWNSNAKEISKTEALKQLEKIDKGQDPKMKVAIQIGIDRHDGEGSKKKYTLLSFAKDSSRGAAAKLSPASKAAAEKEKATLAKQKKANELEEKLLAEAAIKKFQTKTLSDKIIQGLVIQLLQETNNDDKIIEPLMAMGVKFKMSAYGKKETLVFNGKDPLQNYADYNIDDIDDVISALTGAKLSAIASITLASCFYGAERNDFYKDHKIDVKSIANKAKSQAAAWWAAEQAKKKTAVKSFVKTEGRKPSAPVKAKQKK